MTKPARGLLVLLIVLGVFLAVLYLAVAAAFYQKFERREPANIDFAYFYAGARNLLSDPHHVYDRATMEDAVLETQGLERGDVSQEERRRLRYYNPPFFLLLFVPFSLLGLPTGYLTSLVVNVLACAALIYLSGVFLNWRRPITLFAGAGICSFIPLHIAFYNSQPTILIALLLLAAFMAAQDGKRLRASVLVALSGAKPHWTILTSLALLRRSPRVLWPLVAVGSLLLLSPFVLLGLGALTDYLALFTERTSDNVQKASYGESLFAWLAFFRALTGTSQPAATAVMSLLTLLAFLVVLVRGDRYLTWSAAILTTLLVVPHGYAHEWIVAVPAAVVLLARPMEARARGITVALLLLGHLAMNTSFLMMPLVREGGWAVYWVVPMALVVVAWCAVLPVLERRVPVRIADETPGAETGAVHASVVRR